jgi:hypothetical protein
MRSQDQNADNLFLRLFSYTPREGRSALEDFCTEALAWCLRNSLDFRKSVFSMTGLRPLQDYVQSIEIDTQHSFKIEEAEEPAERKAPHGPEQSVGRFDMIIRSANSDFVVVFETKLWNPPGKDQLEKYRRDLANGAQFKCYPPSNRFLVSLTALTEKPALVDAHLVWGDIQAELARMGTNSKEDTHETTFTQKVCLQFAEFLKEKGLARMNIGKIDQETISSFVKCMKVRDELEVVLKSLATSVPVLRGKRLRYFYYTDQKVGYLCLYPGVPEVLDAVAFAFKQSDKDTQLAMHVSKMLKGDWRSLIPTFDERLAKCFIYKEHSYLPGANEGWFNFEQPVTGEYDGNGEKMREWFVQTCEAVMKLGKVPA